MAKTLIIAALVFCNALLAFAQEKPTTAPATSTAASKKVVQGAQERLQALGYQPGSADGVMGTKAIAALKKFQSDHGLPATGVLDRKTLDTLYVTSVSTNKPQQELLRQHGDRWQESEADNPADALIGDPRVQQGTGSASRAFQG